ADLAGSWVVDLAAPEASQAAGVPGLIMKITPPATADPEAEVAISVDYTTFADLYGPQAADRFGLMLLPDCVYDDPDGSDCATDGGSGTISATADTDTVQAVPSEVKLVPAEESPSRLMAADAGEEEGEGDESMRRVVTGRVPVGALLDGQSAPSGEQSSGP